VNDLPFRIDDVMQGYTAAPVGETHIMRIFAAVKDGRVIKPFLLQKVEGGLAVIRIVESEESKTLVRFLADLLDAPCIRVA